jgi:para-aminobenzoate synthetase/4-amino-4-deoxychorismate lyase
VIEISDPTTPFVLCDDNFSQQKASWLFTGFQKAVSIDHIHSSNQFFTEIEEYLDKGFYVAGYATYELAQAFGLKTHRLPNKPLAYFGVFSDRACLSESDVENLLNTKEVFELKKNVSSSFEDYQNALKQIETALRSGDTYQVNYTIRCLLETSGCFKSLYSALRTAQPVEYGAFLNFEHCTILSRSPELFFKKAGSHLMTKPMKGTAQRKVSPAEDAKTAQKLQSDPKTRSENMMIVDLLRNDFGRIAKTGSVKVDSLMELETYATVHQIVSTISCEVDDTISLFDIFKALFPCGSVTGAPKKSTMEIINTLEPTPRGIYTGAIGYITPDRDMCFNVPIRTLEFDNTQTGVMGIGSGVVAASDAHSEWEECLLKAKFLDTVCSR